MKYFLIAGEASGDLHAAQLITALRKRDQAAKFRFFGGDEMARAAGCAPLRHYSTLAYMGIVQVALHLRTILRGMRECKEAIAEWRPDCVILIDYPGFNLDVAKYVHARGICPVYYYISPKIWAWKEGRIKRIRRDVDHLFSILPFEKAFFEEKHHYPITYVGNPSVDELFDSPRGGQGQTILLMPGSRTAEITGNLPIMLQAALPYQQQGYRIVVAKAPAQPRALYDRIMDFEGATEVLLTPLTSAIIADTTVALVTSGTATLETAILDIPQVVCYSYRGGRLINWLRPLILKVPYISLPNLVCGREIVPELIAADMKVPIVAHHLASLMPGQPAREKQLRDYEEMRQILGSPGAPERCSDAIINRLNAL